VSSQAKLVRLRPGSTSTAASASGFDFRNARWGQTKQQVIALERIKLQQIPNGSLGGLDGVDHRKFWVFWLFVRLVVAVAKSPSGIYRRCDSLAVLADARNHPDST
jgi:hypothetical protein